MLPPSPVPDLGVMSPGGGKDVVLATIPPRDIVKSSAMIVTAPPEPSPKVVAVICPRSLIASVLRATTSTSPALPVAAGSTWLVMPVKDCPKLPTIDKSSVAITTSAASPTALVAAPIEPPLAISMRSARTIVLPPPPSPKASLLILAPLRTLRSLTTASIPPR